MSGYQNGSKFEGLGFNLCVAPPCIVVSLISKDKGRVRDHRSEVGDDFVIKTEVGQGRRGEGSKSYSKKRTMLKISRYSN